MFKYDTDRDWEQYGRQDPYFGVLTHEQFHRKDMTVRAREEFFATGVQHVAHVFDGIRTHLSPDFAPKAALDFGCGVGKAGSPPSGANRPRRWHRRLAVHVE